MSGRGIREREGEGSTHTNGRSPIEAIIEEATSHFRSGLILMFVLGYQYGRVNKEDSPEEKDIKGNDIRKKKKDFKGKGLDQGGSKKAKPKKNQQGKSFICSICREKGHISNNCPNPRKGCSMCCQFGHLMKDCPELKKPAQITKVYAIEDKPSTSRDVKGKDVKSDKGKRKGSEAKNCGSKQQRKTSDWKNCPLDYTTINYSALARPDEANALEVNLDMMKKIIS